MNTNLTLATVNYEKPLLAFNAIISFAHMNEFASYVDLILFDNSSSDKSADFFLENNVPFVSGKEYDIHSWPDENKVDGRQTCHGNAIREAINLCKTKYLLLIDSDVEFKMDISFAFAFHVLNNNVITGLLEQGRFPEKPQEFIAQYPNATASAYDNESRVIYPRICPHYMLIDMEQWRENDMYFNGDAVWPEGGCDPNIEKDIKDAYEINKGAGWKQRTVFDVGSYPLWQVNRKKLKAGVLKALPLGETVTDENNIFINHFNSESRLNKTNSIYPELEKKYTDLSWSAKKIFGEIQQKNFYRKVTK